MASSADKAYRFDVFLSFCGKDTRDAFTDHLYEWLMRAGIHTFRDNEGINKGEQLQPEFKKAIEESRASIVVLSKNYATSTWCLDELLLILQQRRDCNHFVLPVFYGVEPTEIRKHKGTFAIQVKPSSKWTQDKVDKWKAALMEVADLAGHVVVSGPETSILKQIVDTVYNKLDCGEVSLPSNLIGMDTRYKEISSWLDQPNLEFLVIHGIGGSGKTTLAKYIYNSNRRKFQSVSFLEVHNGLLELQEQLVKDISLGKKRKIPDVSRGVPVIEKALQMNRALIVLDDVTESKQLDSLLGTTGEIHAQSKIIVTTRENADDLFAKSRWRCQKLAMKLLNHDESLELFCFHALESKEPTMDLQEIVQCAVKYCEGHPMALEVLGSSMFKIGTDDVKTWVSEMRSFETEIDSRLQDVLIKSYESLPNDDVKELFLHISCFFKGIDMDYVRKILEPDYPALSGIQTLIRRGLLSVSPTKTLMMHRLLQEMGRNIVRKESTKDPAERSRVWLSRDSYKILSKEKGSKTLEGLALDMHMLLSDENFAIKSSEFKTKAVENMDNLKFLQLTFVKLNGTYENFPEYLRWLCWLEFHLTAIPSELNMGNLVAIDMSNSKLEVFEPPEDIQCLKILNLKDSHKLKEIRNISRIPKLETLILWNCYSLVSVCKTIGGLTNLSLLNTAGCKYLFNRKQIDRASASTSGGLVTEQHTFSFPVSLHRLFLKDCHLKRTHSFPLSFIDQPFLQYLNLGSSLFKSLPCYDHLLKLRVLDLSFCSSLTCLIGLPSTLAELYIYGCELLERITFQSRRFTLQEFGYKGCINLYEVEGFIKLVPIAKLNETDLGHMKRLKEYQNHQVCLVGDDELTAGRSRQIQMLYEFDIMSTSLPDMKVPIMIPRYISMLSTLSFDVPWCPENKRLKGINVTFKYSMFGEDWAWFCKISTTNGVVDWMYNPKVFGKPEVGEVCIWLSYWPIGNTLNIGDTVNVSIVVISGLEVHECGVSLVYSNEETLENNMGWIEILGGDLSGFELSTGGYYLCRRDYFELMEVGRLTLDWFRSLVGDTIDYTEIRGWRKTGRPKQVNDPSFTELKMIRCIIHGPQLEDIYDKPYKSDDIMIGESDPNSLGRTMNSATGEGKKSSSAHQCCRFSLTEIQSATKNFSAELVIGYGEFGTVYKGEISGEEASHMVAIKRLDSMSHQHEPEFWDDINFLCKLRHHHLVSLIGYCDDNKEKVLVYEYMPNGTLYHNLHQAHTPLSWVTRLKIAIGVARGLDYLHTGLGTQHGVIHRDVKSSNILLDENWVAMISDFGLSKIGRTNQSSTFGYLDPEYFFTGRLTMKSDVYAFGVVLFELLSGRLPRDKRCREDECSLVRWAQRCLKERKFDQIVDPSIKGTLSSKCLRQFAQIAASCANNASKKRPTMSKLVASLQALLELQEKSDRSAESSGIMGFLWNIYKYIVPATKPNSEQSGSSSQKNLDDNKNQHDE